MCERWACLERLDFCMFDCVGITVWILNVRSCVLYVQDRPGRLNDEDTIKRLIREQDELDKYAGDDERTWLAWFAQMWGSLRKLVFFL